MSTDNIFFFAPAPRVAVFDVDSVVSATLKAAPCFQDRSQDPGNITCVNSLEMTWQ